MIRTSYAILFFKMAEKSAVYILAFRELIPGPLPSSIYRENRNYVVFINTML